jgi:hypothetical protein
MGIAPTRDLVQMQFNVANGNSVIELVGETKSGKLSVATATRPRRCLRDVSRGPGDHG